MVARQSHGRTLWDKSDQDNLRVKSCMYIFMDEREEERTGCIIKKKNLPQNNSGVFYLCHFWVHNVLIHLPRNITGAEWNKKSQFMWSTSHFYYKYMFVARLSQTLLLRHCRKKELMCVKIALHFTTPRPDSIKPLPPH